MECIMDKQELKRNILSKSQWLRVLFMLLFATIYTVVFVLAKLVIVLQVLFALVSAKPNTNIQQVSNYLNCYIYHILNYLTYLTDKKPFPFTSLKDTLEIAANGLSVSELDANVSVSTENENLEVTQKDVSTSNNTQINKDIDAVVSESNDKHAGAELDAELAPEAPNNISTSSDSTALADFLDKQKKGNI